MTAGTPLDPRRELDLFISPRSAPRWPSFFPFSIICSIKTSLCFIKGLQNRFACCLSCESCLCAQCQKPGLWEGGEVLWSWRRTAASVAGIAKRWRVRVCVKSVLLQRTEACPVLQATSVWNILHNKLALIALPLLLSILPTTLTFKLARPNPRGWAPWKLLFVNFEDEDSLFKCWQPF